MKIKDCEVGLSGLTYIQVNTVKHGSPTFSGKEPQPLLWAGPQAARVKFTIYCLPNHLYHCVIFIVHT